MTDSTITGRLRILNGDTMGDEVKGVVLTIQVPKGPHGLELVRTGTITVSDDPEFSKRHHQGTLMFFPEDRSTEPFDIQIIHPSGAIRLVPGPVMKAV